MVSAQLDNETFGYYLGSNTSLLPEPNGTAPNATDPPPVFPAYIRTASMLVCILILGIGVVGNVMVPLVILKTKDMRNSTNIFLMNLSIADLMVLLVCTPTVLVEVNSKPETWVLGEHMCKAVPFIELTVAHASVLTILAISFERYYAICEPLRAGYVCTKPRAILICLFAWTFAALFTSPVLLVAEYRLEEYWDHSLVPVCLMEASTFWPAFYFLVSITLFFLVPLAILLVLYSVIAHHLMSSPCLGAAPSARPRRQVVLMLATVVLSFFLCLLPFRALTLAVILAPPEFILSLGIETYYNLLYFSRIMLYINSAINPILYNLMSSKFRDGFRRLCGGKDSLVRKGTLTTTTLTSSSSGRRSANCSERLIKRGEPRLVSIADSPKFEPHAPLTTSIKLNYQIPPVRSEESYV